MSGPVSLPTLEVKKVYELPRSKPVAPSPGCPFEISVRGTISVNGTATPSAEEAGIDVKGSFSKGKVELEQAVKTEFCEVKFKEEVEAGRELSQIGIELGREGFPLAISLDAHADFRAPITFGVKWPNAIKVKSRELKIPGSSNGFIFSGTVDPQLDIGITANPAWPGWKNALQLLARQSSSVLRTGASAVRGVYFATEMGTVSAAGVAAVATGVFLCGVAWLTFGLYSIAKASRDGRSVGIRRAFSNGYAGMLADLTSNTLTFTPQAVDAAKRLLEIPWQTDLAKAGSQYLIGGGDYLREVMLSNQITSLGGAAICQDVDRYVKSRGTAAWATLTRAQRQRYGEDDVARKRAYISILYHQVDVGADPLGIALA